MARTTPRIVRDESRLGEFTGVGSSLSRLRFDAPPGSAAGASDATDFEAPRTPDVGSHPGWMLPVCLATLAVAVVAIALVSLRPTATPTASNAVPTDSAASSATGFPPAPAPEEIARRFLAASTVEEKLALVRDRERLGAEIAAHYRNRPTTTDGVVALQEVAREEEAAGCVGLFAAGFPDGTARLVAVVESPAGTRLVDWECFAGSPPFVPSGETTLRVVLTRSDYFNEAFADADAWESFEARPAYGDAWFHAYAPRGSPLADLLARRLDARAPGQRLTLRLRFAATPEAGIAQAEIVELTAPTWIAPIPPRR